MPIGDLPRGRLLRGVCKPRLGRDLEVALGTEGLVIIGAKASRVKGLVGSTVMESRGPRLGWVLMCTRGPWIRVVPVKRDLPDHRCVPKLVVLKVGVWVRRLP